MAKLNDPIIRCAPDLWAVAVDEQYEADWMRENRVKSVYTVYVYDRKAHTHLCEITPSYELRRVYTEWVPEGVDSEGDDWYERNSERISDEIREAEAYSELYSYMHVSDIEAISRDLKIHYGSPFDYRSRNKAAKKYYESIGHPEWFKPSDGHADWLEYKRGEVTIDKLLDELCESIEGNPPL